MPATSDGAGAAGVVRPRPSRTRAPLGLALLLVAGGCAAPSEPDGQGSPALLAARLPEQVAGFQRQEVIPAGAAQEEGRAVSYATPGRRAAGALVELIARPAAGAPDGPDSPPAAAALAAMLDEVTRPGAPRRVQAEGRLALPQAGPGGGAPALSCVETRGRYGRERVQGLLCAGVLRGVLVRLRVTMPQLDPPAADPRAFATGIVAALRASSTR